MGCDPSQSMSNLDDLHGNVIRTAFALWYGWKPYGQHAALLEKTQWWAWSEIQALQMRKLNTLLEYAYANVPFYRRRFDEAGVRPRAIHTPADLVHLPPLTKQEIQDHRDELLASGVNRRRLRQNHTGGSTGQPLTFYQDDRFQAWANADLLRTYRMAGYQLGMRWAFLWGSDYDARTHKGWHGRLMDRLVYNALWINTFDLSVDTLTEAARQLVRFQPQILVAYVSSATLLAQFVRDKGIEGIQPRAIQTSAEVLTPDDRRLMEETFGCQVFDRYGCREVYNIAHECAAHQGLHVLAENNVVECLDADGRPAVPGTVGRIVVTNLNNYVMPFIRYEVGDLGVPSQRSCGCGRGLPLLESVMGRTTDVITSPSGKLLHGEFFTHLFYKLPSVRQFRVVQKTRVDLLVQVVPGPGFDQHASFTFLEKAIHRYGDPGFQVRFELCDHIPPASSGKYRFTISHVPLGIGKDDRSAAHISSTHAI